MENFDDIIRKYTEALELMGQTYGGEARKSVETHSNNENESISENATTDSIEAEKVENELKTEEKEVKTAQSENKVESEEYEASENKEKEQTEAEPDSSATFYASVFSGEGTYPVVGARVVIYRGDKIFAFLDTDENGATDRVSLPAYDMENSLEADNPDKSREYLADVFAEGFASQKGLLVSAVGGSEILLRVLMVPEGERFG